MSLVHKDGSSNSHEGGGEIPTVDIKGEKRSKEAYASMADDQARLLKKTAGDKYCFRYIGDALMENPNALVVNVEATLATGKVERETALSNPEDHGGRHAACKGRQWTPRYF